MCQFEFKLIINLLNFYYNEVAKIVVFYKDNLREQNKEERQRKQCFKNAKRESGGRKKLYQFII